MIHWKALISPGESEVRLLVTNTEHRDVLKARLPRHVRHPRALLTLLEGLALWHGAPLCTAISADDSCRAWLGTGLFGDELWPGESQLVRFEIVHPVRPKRLRGLGSFRDLYRGMAG